MAIKLKEYNKVEPGLYQNKKTNKKWLIRTRINDKLVSKTFTVEEDTKLNMKLHAMSKMASFIDSRVTTEDNTVDFYFKKWTNSKTWSEDYRYSMDKAYGKHIETHIGSKLIGSVTTGDITDILEVKGLSLRVQKTITEILFPLFKYVTSNKYITLSPIVEGHIVTRDSAKEKKRIQNAPEKYKKVYDAILSLEPRNKALMLLGFHGRRKTEALTLRWEDISSNTYTIRAEVNKVDENMTYTLPEDIKTVLEELKSEQDPTGYIFESPKKAGSPMVDIRDIVGAVREGCGLEEFGFHWMRNLAVSALYQAGVSTSEDLSGMLGHNDLNTLKKYLTDDKEKATQRTTAAAARLLGGA